MKIIKKLSLILFVALFVVTLNISTVPQKNGVSFHVGPTIAKADITIGPIMPDVVTTSSAVNFK